MEMNERRQNQRVNVECGIFLTVRPGFKKIGRVKDISLGGICFEYAVFEDYEKLNFCEVDILSETGKFHLIKIPCRVAYDVQLSSHPFQQFQMRRCGLQFAWLSESQASQVLCTIIKACKA
jgi:hypothetical protein